MAHDNLQSEKGTAGNWWTCYWTVSMQKGTETAGG